MLRTREWNFRVTLKSLPGEVVGVVGAIPELGSWNHQDGFLLTKSAEIAPDKYSLILFSFAYKKTESIILYFQK